MARLEYMQLKLSNMPDNIINQYELQSKATADGYVYVKIQKGMYRLPHAGLIAQELLINSMRKGINRAH